VIDWWDGGTMLRVDASAQAQKGQVHIPYTTTIVSAESDRRTLPVGRR
jgi:hypothetical protein